MVTGRVGQVCACTEQDAEIDAIADIAAGPIKPRNMTVLRLWEGRHRRANMRISDGSNQAAIGLISTCSPADGIGAGKKIGVRHGPARGSQTIAASVRTAYREGHAVG